MKFCFKIRNIYRQKQSIFCTGFITSLSHDLWFPLHYCMSGCVPLPPSHIPQTTGRGSDHTARSSAQFVPSQSPTPSLQCQPSLGLFPSLPVLTSFYSLSFSFSLFLRADLWDQPSKNDSQFFTDHECVSGNATGRERQSERTCEHVTDIFVQRYLLITKRNINAA